VISAPTKAPDAAKSENASTSKVDHFTVTTNPQTTKVGEAIDLTVTAVDSAGNTKKDYA